VTDAPPPLVLVVEHDADVGRPIVEQLVADGYRARLAGSAEHARALARGDPPGAALLGELQPPRSALALLAEIRGRREGAWWAEMPVIVCSARTQQPDLLRAFETGADDFLARPPGYLELRARLRALLLRAGEHPRACGAVVGALEIDHRARAASLRGHPVQLPRMEYELLAHLAREPHRVFAKDELLQSVWGHPVAIHTRTLDTHASRLRRALRAVGGEQWVVNVRGVGYRLI
jgi:two-component system, OmpR family, phosphate regulon response regulator PhoB